MKILLLQRIFQVKTCFLVLLKLQEKIECHWKKLFLIEKKSENRNDSKIKCTSIEDPLIKHKIASNETTLVPDIQNVFNEENITISPGQRKH